MIFFSYSFFKLIFYCSIVDYNLLITAVWQVSGLSYTHIFFCILFLTGYPEISEYSSLCYLVGLCCLPT